MVQAVLCHDGTYKSLDQLISELQAKRSRMDVDMSPSSEVSAKGSRDPLKLIQAIAIPDVHPKEVCSSEAFESCPGLGAAEPAPQPDLVPSQAPMTPAVVSDPSGHDVFNYGQPGPIVYPFVDRRRPVCDSHKEPNKPSGPMERWQAEVLEQEDRFESGRARIRRLRRERGEKPMEMPSRSHENARRWALAAVFITGAISISALTVYSLLHLVKDVEGKREAQIKRAESLAQVSQKRWELNHCDKNPIDLMDVCNRLDRERSLKYSSGGGWLEACVSLMRDIILVLFQDLPLSLILCILAAQPFIIWAIGTVLSSMIAALKNS